MTLNERLSTIPKLYQLVGLFALLAAGFSVLFNWIGFQMTAPGNRLMGIESRIATNFEAAQQERRALRLSVDSLQDANDTQLFLLCQHLEGHPTGMIARSRVELALAEAYCTDMNVPELLRRARTRQSQREALGAQIP